MTYLEKAQKLFERVLPTINGAYIDPFNEIYEGELYLGGQPQDGMSYPSIKAVLNLQAENYKTLACESILWMPIHDRDDFKGMDWLEITTNYIEKCVSLKRPLLVHCAAGISRSSMVVIAYVMKREQISLEEAWKIVRKKRPCAPNIYFLAGLYEWQDHLGIVA